METQRRIAQTTTLTMQSPLQALIASLGLSFAFLPADQPRPHLVLYLYPSGGDPRCEPGIALDFLDYSRDPDSDIPCSGVLLQQKIGEENMRRALGTAQPPAKLVLRELTRSIELEVILETQPDENPALALAAYVNQSWRKDPGADMRKFLIEVDGRLFPVNPFDYCRRYGLFFPGDRASCVGAALEHFRTTGVHRGYHGIDPLTCSAEPVPLAVYHPTA